jgi:hypothetical protein
LSGQGSARQVLDMSAAFVILDWSRGGGTVAGQGLRFAAEFRVEISPGELKQRVGGIFVDERADNGERSFVLLVVAVEVQGKIKAGRGGSQDTFGHIVFELADAFLLAAARNAHEKAQELGDGAEGIDVIVVEAEAKFGVDKRGVELNGAEKMFASVDAGAGSGTILAAKAVEPGDEGVGHACIELHLGGLAGFELRECDGRGLCGQVEIVLVGGEFGAVARVGHTVLEFGRCAKDSPPQGVRFKQIAQRVAGLLGLEAPRAGDGAIEIERIDFIERGGCSGGQNQFFRAGLRGKEGGGRGRYEEDCAEYFADKFCARRYVAERFCAGEWRSSEKMGHGNADASRARRV